MNSTHGVWRFLACCFSLAVFGLFVGPTSISVVAAQESDPFGDIDGEAGQQADDPFDGDFDDFGDEFEDEFNPFEDAESDPQQQLVKTRKAMNPKTSKLSVADRMRKLGFYGIGDETEAELRILEALEQKVVQFEFNSEPLSSVMQVIEERHSFPIEFKTDALEEESIDPTSDPVSLDISGVKLKHALALMLDKLNLTYIVRNEMLIITSQTHADETLTTKIYRIPEHWDVDGDEFADTLLTMVEPDTWAEVGGPAALKTVKGGIFVSNTSSAHAEIEKVCAKFDILYKENE